jgi:hypothetical protein
VDGRHGRISFVQASRRRTHANADARRPDGSAGSVPRASSRGGQTLRTRHNTADPSGRHSSSLRSGRGLLVHVRCHRRRESPVPVGSPLVAALVGNGDAVGRSPGLMPDEPLSDSDETVEVARQAAGVAAVLSVRDGRDFCEVDQPKVPAELERQSVRIGDTTRWSNRIRLRALVERSGVESKPERPRPASRRRSLSQTPPGSTRCTSE